MNITMIDEKGNKGNITTDAGTFSGASIYRYGGGNDEAWKELSLDFDFKEKLYEGKEIYLIEGDGSKLLTNEEN